MKNDGGSSKILGKGYTENSEEDDQVIQILLNESQGKPRKFIDTPYPSEKNINQGKLSEIEELYPSLSEMRLREKSISTLKMDETDTSNNKISSKYANDYAKFKIYDDLEKYD